jgi:hypothetical protein
LNKGLPLQKFTTGYVHYRITEIITWHSWLMHCATSRTVAGSIPDGVIGIFHWHNLAAL